MKVLKILGILVFVLVAFVALAIYMTANNLNAIVKQAVEQVGTETLQTKVSLAAADVSLTEARARLSGLTIQNMPGYQQKNLFEMDEILVDLDLEAVLEHRINLTEITIQGLRVAVEQQGATTNIQQLMDKLPKSDSSTPKTPEGGSETAAPDVLVRVGKFEFADSTAKLITEQWGEKDLSVPAITLTNLGGDKGVPPDQLAGAIFKPLLKKINQTVEKQLKKLFEDKAKQKLEEKEDELKSKYRSKLDEKLGDDSKAAENALKSMLGR